MLTITRGIVYDFTFLCRSLTPDPDDREDGCITGYWTGDIDTRGKLTIIPADTRESPVYLFQDEITDAEPRPEALSPILLPHLGGL